MCSWVCVSACIYVSVCVCVASMLVQGGVEGLGCSAVGSCFVVWLGATQTTSMGVGRSGMAYHGPFGHMQPTAVGGTGSNLRYLDQCVR